MNHIKVNGVDGVTADQVDDAGPDAIALMVNLMLRNENDARTLQNQLAESLQRDYESTLAELEMVRHNIMCVLAEPHTDAMLYDALYATFKYHRKGPA